MTSIISYKDLEVWQKAMTTVEQSYRLALEFPAYEQFALAGQVRRAAVSIPANIAEGYRRGSRTEYRHFLRIAYGSGAELETHIELARRLYPATKDQCATISEVLDEVMKMLNVLIRRLS